MEVLKMQSRTCVACSKQSIILSFFKALNKYKVIQRKTTLTELCNLWPMTSPTLWIKDLQGFFNVNEASKHMTSKFSKSLSLGHIPTKSHRYTCTIQIHRPFNRGSLTSEYAVCFPTNFVKIHCLLYFPWTQNTYFVQLSRALLILYTILNGFSSHFKSVLLLIDMFRTKWFKRFYLWRRKIRQHKFILSKTLLIAQNCQLWWLWGCYCSFHHLCVFIYFLAQFK